MKVNQYQPSSQEHALGTSLEILKSSGDNIFKKIHRMQIPKESNVISPSLGMSRFSKIDLGSQASKASQAIQSTFKSLKISGKRAFEILPKINSRNNAMGKSFETLHDSSKRIFEKMSKTSKSSI